MSYNANSVFYSGEDLMRLPHQIIQFNHDENTVTVCYYQGMYHVNYLGQRCILSGDTYYNSVDAEENNRTWKMPLRWYDDIPEKDFVFRYGIDDVGIL